MRRTVYIWYKMCALFFWQLSFRTPFFFFRSGESVLVGHGVVSEGSLKAMFCQGSIGSAISNRRLTIRPLRCFSKAGIELAFDTRHHWEQRNPLRGRKLKTVTFCFASNTVNAHRWASGAPCKLCVVFIEFWPKSERCEHSSETATPSSRTEIRSSVLELLRVTSQS